MSSYLITGCSRGLGLAFVRELAQQEPSSVRLIVVTARSQQPPATLEEIISNIPDRVKYIPLDVTSQESISNSVKITEDILGGQGLDVLINNAGISQPESGRSLGMTSDKLLSTFTTNVAAVHNVSRAYMALLRQGRDKKLINISSTLGSIGMANDHPAFFKSLPTVAYNISKAALNSLTVQYAIDLKDEGFTVLVISPGHLQTDLGGMTAPLTADIGAKATLKIIHESSVKDSGRFRNIYVEDDAVHNGKDPVW